MHGATAAPRHSRVRSRAEQQAGLAALMSLAGELTAPAEEEERSGRRRLSILILLGILAVQAALSLRLIWSNTAFTDEALYLWSGHLMVSHLLYGRVIPPFATYFSGAPVVYPVIGAVADSYGGLAGARLLSLAFMLGATALLYSATKRLFGYRAGVSAAAVFGALGPVQYLGAFATYDAMAIFLLALASWLVVQGRGRLGEPALIAAALALALANTTKYASALWDPVVVAMACLTAAQGERLRRLLRGARLAAYLGAVLGVALFRFGGEPYIRGILFTTLARQSSTAPPSGILLDSFTWIGMVFILAVFGTGMSLAVTEKMRLLCGILTVAVLLAPIEQARIHSFTSLQKHVAFGAWFAAIAAGYALARVARINTGKGWRIGAVVVVFMAITGMLQAGRIFQSWPNSARMTHSMQRTVAGIPAGNYLIEDSKIEQYYLPARTQVLTISGPLIFYYWDTSTKKLLSGTPALVAAIRAHYFSVIEISSSYEVDRQVDHVLLATLRKTSGYQEVTSIPFSQEPIPQGKTYNSAFTVWRYQFAGTGRGRRSPGRA